MAKAFTACLHISLNTVKYTDKQRRPWSDCMDLGHCCSHICQQLRKGTLEHTRTSVQPGQDLHCLPMQYRDLAGYRTKSEDLGPVVQSVVSLTSSLRVISLTVLADSIHNILIFFAEKMWVAFTLQKLLTFFQQKISAYSRITQLKF